MDPVHLYLDVDGVLNAVAMADPDWGWPAGETVRVAGFSIRYAPALVERLNALTALPHVRPRWLTTWGYDAATRLSPAIGLRGEDWPVLGSGPVRRLDTGTTWWKLTAIREDLERDPARAVWVDDDIALDPAAQEWAAARPDLLWVAPATTVGLTVAQVEAVEEFVAGPA